MKLSTFAVPMVTPKEPFVDRAGVLVPLTAYKLIQSLWNRTGAGDGIAASIATGLIATGNSQLTALSLTDDWNEIDTVAAGTGVQMPQLSPGQMIAVFNGGANALAIYPFGGAQIDALAVNAAYSLATAKLQLFWVWTLTQIRSFGRLQIP